VQRRYFCDHSGTSSLWSLGAEGALEDIAQRKTVHEQTASGGCECSDHLYGNRGRPYRLIIVLVDRNNSHCVTLLRYVSAVQDLHLCGLWAKETTGAPMGDLNLKVVLTRVVLTRVVLTRVGGALVRDTSWCFTLSLNAQPCCKCRKQPRSPSPSLSVLPLSLPPPLPSNISPSHLPNTSLQSVSPKPLTWTRAQARMRPGFSSGLTRSARGLARVP
jgi:hypothetical protein